MSEKPKTKHRLWAFFCGKQLIYPTVAHTRKEVKRRYPDLVELHLYEVRRVTVVEGWE